ncbi:hypothetical protein GOP47_0000480 [Adiantum capillus-veneris]|uniref:Transmembrane protein n=1 Tax=Adiantum capillus-veneris TaxID=13818 RepID=A0A9D4ZSC9_ADICA|nr:hypothetical protein GOP47_0000480 [Adiantum capillus-veneris]
METEVPNGEAGLQAEHPWSSNPTSFIHRTQESLWVKSAQLQKSLRHASSDLTLWMKKGSPWRAFLVSTVAIVLLLALAGVGTFMFFFLAATLNAVAIGFLASVAAVGAFAALFFSSLIAIYIGALVTAVIFISTITFICICAALTAAGWIAFLWAVWQGLQKGTNFLKGCFGFSVCKLPSNGVIDYQQQYEKPY